MLRAILNKSWQQHPTRHQLYGHLPPITKTIQVRRTRHAGHCWRSRDELISDVLLWTPTHGRAKAGRPAQTYIEQLCEDMGCCPEDLPEAMKDREKWRERVRDIRATSTTWWWWWWWWYITLYLRWNVFWFNLYPNSVTKPHPYLCSDADIFSYLRDSETSAWHQQTHFRSFIYITKANNTHYTHYYMYTLLSYTKYICCDLIYIENVFLLK